MKFFLFVLFLLACVMALSPRPQSTAANNTVPEKVPQRTGDPTIFIYHHFGDKRYPTTSVSEENFLAQMRYLADNGYRVLSLAEVVHCLKAKIPLPEKTAVITIDDGYRSIYSVAWPILKSFGFPFTVFLYVEGVEKKYSNYLSWEQILEMQAAGVDFQDHSFSHHRMADWPRGVTEKEYRKWVRADLVSSVTILREKLGKRPRFFAIPYGEYNSIVLEEARSLGYDAIFTQDPGSVSADTDPFFIPREPILGKEWATLDHFIKVLNRADLPVANLTPSISPLEKAVPAVFGARVLYPERYDSGSFGIYVSELGWRKATMDSKGFVSMRNDLPLTRRSNRVMISAREKGTNRSAVRFWLLLQHEANRHDPEAMQAILGNQTLGH
ncbi:polysaccharide deacetylase family protein [Thiovibrio sp. JS02]